MNDLMDVLVRTYQKRQALNPLYSRNAFARDLGISPTALSQFLSGKRIFAKKNHDRIIQSLNLSPTEVQTSVRKITMSPSTLLHLETFALIADWYHIAILNLSEIEEIRSTTQIAKRLGITPKEAKDATERLLKLNLMHKTNGQLKRSQSNLDTGTDVPSEAIRKHNREKMELAIAALNRLSVQERDISSLTVTFNMKNMPQLKNEIIRFKRRIRNLCNSFKDNDEVYSLNIQFFPISKKKESLR